MPVFDTKHYKTRVRNENEILRSPDEKTQKTVKKNIWRKKQFLGKNMFYAQR